MRVRIVDVPPGEAPEDVRQSWVGLSLPVAAPYPSADVVPCYGVLTGPRTWLGHLWRRVTGRTPACQTCYFVWVDDAIAELAVAAPHAADWWRENTPDLIGVGQLFGFPVQVCEPEDEPAVADSGA